MRRTGPAGLAALVLLAGCGGGAKPVSGPIVDATVTPASLSIRIAGATSFSFSGHAPVKIIVTNASSVAQPFRLTSVFTSPSVKSAGAEVQAGFNLIGATGDGSFQIPPRTGASPGVTSIVSVQLLGQAKHAYDRPTKTCTGSTQNHARSGSLNCPAIADAAGKVISFTMTWAV